MGVTQSRGSPGQQAVSSSTFDQISRYHSFAAAAYADECPTPPFGSKVVQYFNVSSTDTQATLFYAGSSDNELVISFRGSSTPIDLDIDLDYAQVDPDLSGVTCPDCKIHRGFQNAYNSVSDEVISAIKKAQSQYPSSSLVLTGHSLGGGLAALASAQFASRGLDFQTFTYGEPRNGNSAWSKYVDSKVSRYHRVTHYNDGVPQIPPTFLDFQHHGTEYWLSSECDNTASSTIDCGGGDPENCNAKTDYGVSPINGAHIAYIGLTSTSLFNPGCGYEEPS